MSFSRFLVQRDLIAPATAARGQLVWLYGAPADSQLLRHVLPRQISDDRRNLQQPAAPSLGLIPHWFPEAAKAYVRERLQHPNW